jgi:starch-binding outer membrane protein, SusD/RagB family
MKSLTYLHCRKLILAFFCVVIIFSSCKKFVEVSTPNNALNGPAVFSSDPTAVASLNGLYVTMTDQTFIQGRYGISMLAGVSSDELDLYSSSVFTTGEYYQNNLSNQSTALHWQSYYGYMQTLNSILDGLSKSTSISEPVKKQLQGESKFLRAFFYFYLVNLYGDVPLLLTSDWRLNSTASRTPKDKVWQQIIQDLKDAQSLLSDVYLQGDAKTPYVIGKEERVRPTKWAASALLARAYLYTGDWVNAEVQAASIINNVSYFSLLPDLNVVFLKNSQEAIWQLMPPNPTSSTKDAPLFIMTAIGPNSNRPAYLSSSLLSSFEQNDKRKDVGNWVDNRTVSGKTYFFPFKYKERFPLVDGNPTEYFMVFRLAEQYLIRAEARAKQNKIAEAQSDLNGIRNRAGLPNTTAADQNSLIAAILHERQLELFTELGNRWLDLKRTGSVDAVMTAIAPLKSPGTQWQSYKQYWPIYIGDIHVNPNLTQTPGY